MAEILIFDRESRPGERGWKRGMPVVIKEDGHEWGTMERPSAGRFALVKMPGVPVETLVRDMGYLEPAYDETDEAVLTDPEPVARRRWRLAIEELEDLEAREDPERTAQMLAALRSDGGLVVRAWDDLDEMHVDWSEARERVLDVRDERAEDRDIPRPEQR